MELLCREGYSVHYPSNDSNFWSRHSFLFLLNILDVRHDVHHGALHDALPHVHGAHHHDVHYCSVPLHTHHGVLLVDQDHHSWLMFWARQRWRHQLEMRKQQCWRALALYVSSRDYRFCFFKQRHLKRLRWKEAYLNPKRVMMRSLRGFSMIEIVVQETLCWINECK